MSTMSFGSEEEQIGIADEIGEENSKSCIIYYYGYRTVNPITKVPPYDACIYKGVVFYRDFVASKEGEKEIRIYESWRTFSSPVEAANDALDWASSTPDWHFASGVKSEVSSSEVEE